MANVPESKPKVLELFASSANPGYNATHFNMWLRMYGIPRKDSSGGFPNGKLLSKEDAELIGRARYASFGKFIFLKAEVSPDGVPAVVEALKRASRIYWHEWNSFREDIQVVETPEDYPDLQKCLRNCLTGSHVSQRSREDTEKAAGLFAVFCGGNRELVKELALAYNSVTRSNSAYASRALASEEAF